MSGQGTFASIGACICLWSSVQNALNLTSSPARIEKFAASSMPEPVGITPMKKWQCIVCGLIYNEADGWPDDGIAPGTLWQDVPEDWLCPECGVGKMDFEMIEIN